LVGLDGTRGVHIGQASGLNWFVVLLCRKALWEQGVLSACKYLSEIDIGAVLAGADWH
jgi:hypothetical protein